MWRCAQIWKINTQISWFCVRIILIVNLSFKSHTISLQYKTDAIVLMLLQQNKLIDHINDVTDIFWTDGELHNRDFKKIYYLYVVCNFISKHTLRNANHGIK